MTKSRIQSLIWLFIVLTIYIYLDSYFAFFLLIISIITFIFLGISNKMVINKLEFKLYAPETMSKAESDTFYIEAINKGVLPIGKLKYTVALKNVLTGEEELDTAYVSLGSKGKDLLHWDFKSKYCGKIEIKLKEVICYDYFGIFSSTIRSDAFVDVLILPETFNTNINLIESQTENLESPVYSDNKIGIDNTEIVGIKEYIPGDDFKNIHWKLTSKLDDLVVKELGSTIENSILVILETSILKDKREVPSVVDAMMEAFISISKSLTEDSKMHSIGWLDHELGKLIVEEINSVDSLTNLIRGFLESEKKKNIYSAMDYYFNIMREDLFTHIIYITSQNPDEYLQDLMNGADVTVLQCKPSDAGSNDTDLDYGIVFTPENIKEELYQLIV